jgi:hypothetical protein
MIAAGTTQPGKRDKSRIDRCYEADLGDKECEMARTQNQKDEKHFTLR